MKYEVIMNNYSVSRHERGTAESSVRLNGTLSGSFIIRSTVFIENHEADDDKVAAKWFDETFSSEIERNQVKGWDVKEYYLEKVFTDENGEVEHCEHMKNSEYYYPFEETGTWEISDDEEWITFLEDIDPSRHYYYEKFNDDRDDGTRHSFYGFELERNKHFGIWTEHAYFG